MRFGILSRGAPLVSWALAFGWGWGGASDAWAQYFGGNQVKYKEFDFQVMKTEHLDVYYYPEEREAVALAAPMAERWYARLSRILDHQFESRQPVILYAGHPHFQQTNAIPVSPGEGTGGVSEVFKRRVLLPFAGSLAETDHVLGHELVHAFQFDITGKLSTMGAESVPAAVRLPRWFTEGMAEYLSLGSVDPHTAMWMRDALLHDTSTGGAPARRRAVFSLSLRPGAPRLYRRSMGRSRDGADLEGGG
jgi:hypothetical protein